jgi:hypothetical protein
MMCAVVGVAGSDKIAWTSALDSKLKPACLYDIGGAEANKFDYNPVNGV